MRLFLAVVLSLTTPSAAVAARSDEPPPAALEFFDDLLREQRWNNSNLDEQISVSVGDILYRRADGYVVILARNCLGGQPTKGDSIDRTVMKSIAGHASARGPRGQGGGATLSRVRQLQLSGTQIEGISSAHLTDSCIAELTLLSDRELHGAIAVEQTMKSTIKAGEVGSYSAELGFQAGTTEVETGIGGAGHNVYDSRGRPVVVAYRTSGIDVFLDTRRSGLDELRTRYCVLESAEMFTRLHSGDSQDRERHSVPLMPDVLSEKNITLLPREQMLELLDRLGTPEVSQAFFRAEVAEVLRMHPMCVPTKEVPPEEPPEEPPKEHT